MQDAARKSSASRSARKKRRKRNLTLHYILVLILVIAVGTVLSLTVLFNITAVEVSGDVPYEAQMIIDCSNIRNGDNLLRTKTKKAEDKILQQLVYIDTVHIKKILPSKILIQVTRSEPFANLEYDGKFLLISKKGKILESRREPEEGLFMIKGYEPVSVSVGSVLTSEDKAKDKLLDTIYTELENIKIDKNMEIDITDRYNIKLLYDGRINIELGSQNDIEYKIRYAKTVIDTKIPEKKMGTLFMLGEDRASFVEKSDLEKFYENYNEAKTSVSETEEDNVSGILPETAQSQE